MNKRSKIIVLLTLFVLVAANATYARKWVGTVHAPMQKDESATCLPATNSNELTINNVRAYVETNGTMWFKEIAQYEVPRGSGKTSMFAAALWIGGRDVSGQLRLAAVRFRQVGDDFWTGPLTVDGASTLQNVCSYYDKHYKVTRAEVEAHIAAHLTNDPTYVMPASISNWKEVANPSEIFGDDYSLYCAPYNDVDGNLLYTPEGGDYPYYDLDNEYCPWTTANIELAAQDRLPWAPERTWFKERSGIDNKMILADHVLKGDETLFWVFNDKGGPHTETQGDPIGLEIRGQAFAFATNDEINNMTFYSYEIVNRSTFKLTNCYFSQWVDPDLGFAEDDMVGCDVARGLGYCYNGRDVDGTGLTQHYGSQPPAVGVDFFQGPYIDPDGRDNPKFYVDSASFPGYCDRYLNSSFENDQMAINGVNFGDDIVDNERFGMRRFVYHNNDNSVIGDPSVAFEYYYMLQGIWGDGTKMRYGKNAHQSQTQGPECDFMFPGLTDPCNWGTKGVDPNYTADGGWTEANENNAPGDRRFMQSAGPFTLEAGAVNYITVGIPWARASQGGAWASVELLKIADDKCQALFENCFKVLDGPDAPDVVIRELDKELILYISNDDPLSNNFNETYEEEDAQIPESRTDEELVIVQDSIVTPDSVYYYDRVESQLNVVEYDRKYRFEGYKIYQLKNNSVSVADLDDLDKARLVAQCDIENYDENGNPIGQLVNWVYNDALGTSVATEMVNGANNGLFHSLKITQDQFATGSNALVNYKTYYFMVIAYAYNNYQTYSIDPDIPNGLVGQKTVYLAGRKAAGGTAIAAHSAIPHPALSHNTGTTLRAEYGTQPMITRIEGQGNGGNYLDLTDESIKEILTYGKVNSITYKNNAGPLSIKVIDPLKLQPFDYKIRFVDAAADVTDSTTWVLEFGEDVADEDIVALGYKDSLGNALRAIPSDKSITQRNEQLFLPLGISVSIENYDFQVHQTEMKTYLDSAVQGYDYQNKLKFAQVDFLGSEIVFEDENHPWLGGLQDTEGEYPSNWIRAGQQSAGAWEEATDVQDGVEDEYIKWRVEDFFVETPKGSLNDSWKSRAWKDPLGQFEGAIDGTWSPYVLSSPYDGGPQAKYVVPDEPDFENGAISYDEPLPAYFTHKLTLYTNSYCPGYNQTMTNLYSVDVVLTPNEPELWTRCIVLEACEDNALSIGGAYKQEPRKSPSVDKNGNPDGSGTTGMGWFPGYAINVETGERLNIMFSENSADTANNGDDMLFNPTDVYAYSPEGEEINEATYNSYRDLYMAYGLPEFKATLAWGGRHYIYIVGSSGNTSANYYKLAPSAVHRNWDDDGIDRTANGVHHGGGGFMDGNNVWQNSYYDCGAYGECRWLVGKFSQFTGIDNINDAKRKLWKMQLFNNVMWTSIAMPQQFQSDYWMSSKATIKLRVSRPYMRYNSRYFNEAQAEADADYATTYAANNGYPLYSFTTKNIAPVTNDVTTHETVLDNINIVPNPYYGYSTYESTALETYVKITNLPEKCDISIYTVSGVLVRKLTKGDAESTYVTWDLKNSADIPIAGGMYIIHVKADGIGERTLKFFCAMRPTDLNAF